jgi:Zn-dependent peptidase ImmA (M78 family)
MPRETLPINPRLVEWARKRAGFTIQEATEKFPHITAWEAGEEFPSYPQLERLGKEFKVPLAVFFFPEPPQSPPIRESFRTLPDTEFNQIPRRVGFLLRKAKALQLNLAELSQGNPASRLITRDLVFDDNLSIQVMARRVRDYLEVKLIDQYAWADDDAALKAWRQSLLGVGIFVFKDAFRVDDYFGFSLYDDVFPIIYVNNSASRTRQIFTLAHELAHLLFRTSGIDTLDGYIPGLPARQRHIENLCNRFATQLLVPEEAFDEATAGHNHSEHTAEVLAAHFHVSREVIYRKFLDRRWIGQAEYTRAAQHWASQRQSGGSGGDFYWNTISYLGRAYIALALKQYHQNRIDAEQLAEYLNTKPKNISALEEYFSRGGQ